MRYIILVSLNLPIILLAYVNLLTQYKMKRIGHRRFTKQFALWTIVLTILIGSFPIYNIINHNPPLESIDLSAFDIVQTTAIIWLFYMVNDQRRKIEQSERRLRDMHQELSIKLSK